MNQDSLYSFVKHLLYFNLKWSQGKCMQILRHAIMFFAEKDSKLVCLYHFLCLI